MNFDFPGPDPAIEVFEKWGPFLIVYGLILVVIYILWKVIEWLLKRDYKKERKG